MEKSERCGYCRVSDDKQCGLLKNHEGRHRYTWDGLGFYTAETWPKPIGEE